MDTVRCPKHLWSTLILSVFLLFVGCSGSGGGDGSSSSWTSISMEGAPDVKYGYSWVWTGDDFIIWGGVDKNSNVINAGTKYSPSKDQWTPINSEGSPSPRSYHSAIWTGSEMIIWGASSSGDGGIYNPATDTWRVMSTQNAPGNIVLPTLVWTGYEMIVLEAYKIYNPQTDTWRPISVLDPYFTAARYPVVWNGTELLTYGHIYNPETDTWRVMKQSDDSTLYCFIDVGEKMFAYGYNIIDGTEIDGGSLYDYAADQWSVVSNTNVPRLRKGPILIWTGTEVWVLGGTHPTRWNPNNPPPPYVDGGRYNPTTDTWKSTPTLPYSLYYEGDNAPVEYAWTGVEIVIITLDKGKGLRLKVTN